jgi:excisionase family DNA binding protein
VQLRDAAQTLGVHYQTAYGWVREGTLSARKTPRGYEVSESDVRALAERRARGTEPRTEIRVRDWAAQAAGLYDALVTGDETRARQTFARLTPGVPLSDLCDLVIAPAMRRIGDEWAAGNVSVAVEHRASAICERLVASRAQQPQGRPRGIAVTATPPGERHTLPPLMAAACLRDDRWRVHHLGADLPVADLIELTRAARADLVVLSSTTPDSTNRVRQVEREILASLPGVSVVTGRQGATLRELLERASAIRKVSVAADLAGVVADAGPAVPVRKKRASPRRLQPCAPTAARLLSQFVPRETLPANSPGPACLGGRRGFPCQAARPGSGVKYAHEVTQVSRLASDNV